jgi:hypothetical protein
MGNYVEEFEETVVKLRNGKFVETEDEEVGGKGGRGKRLVAVVGERANREGESFLCGETVFAEHLGDC